MTPAPPYATLSLKVSIVSFCHSATLSICHSYTGRQQLFFIHAIVTQYEGGEPCSVCGHRLQRSSEAPTVAPATVPTPILQGWLYLGSYDTASRSDLLRAMGITHILNVRALQAVPTPMLQRFCTMPPFGHYSLVQQLSRSAAL